MSSGTRCRVLCCDGESDLRCEDRVIRLARDGEIVERDLEDWSCEREGWEFKGQNIIRWGHIGCERGKEQ